MKSTQEDDRAGPPWKAFVSASALISLAPAAVHQEDHVALLDTAVVAITTLRIVVARGIKRGVDLVVPLVEVASDASRGGTASRVVCNLLRCHIAPTDLLDDASRSVDIALDGLATGNHLDGMASQIPERSRTESTFQEASASLESARTLTVSPRSGWGITADSRIRPTGGRFRENQQDSKCNGRCLRRVKDRDNRPTVPSIQTTWGRSFYIVLCYVAC